MQNKVSYRNLYTQVIDEINKRNSNSTKIGYDSKGVRSQTVDPVSFSLSSSEVSTTSILNAVMDLLEELVAPKIKSGLTAEATSPISNKIKITAGVAIIGGRIYRLVKDTTIEVPFDGSSSVFYINLYSSGVKIEKNPATGYVTIAKVIVPNPYISVSRVKNKREDDYEGDAYIISNKEIVFFGDSNGNLEEESIDYLRDNIGEILADNIIGNIRLSENLKIINTAGTLEINSNSVKIKDFDENILMKLNDKGTYFYNTSGIELARFTSIDARIGNIIVDTSSIYSGNFVSGALGSGFRIQDTGYAEFQDVYIRGKFTASVFEKNTISSVGGNLLVSDSDVLDEDMTAHDSSDLVITGDTYFEAGDILRIKDALNDEWMEVVSRTDNTYTVIRDKAGDYAGHDNPEWKKGTAVVKYGQSGEGLIYMTASEDTAPYLSILTHAGNPWDTTTTRVRMGNLNGFLGYTSDLYGIAIGETDSYLKYDPTNGLRIKGEITITGGNASVTFYQTEEPTSGMKDGDYWIDTDDNNTMYVYDSGSWQLVSAQGVTTFRQSSIPTANNAGDLWIDSDDDKLYRATNSGDDEITPGEWELIDAAVATGWAYSGDSTYINGGTIYTGTIVANSIAATTITADKMNVSTLSSISANIGTITAGTITGTTIRTAATGQRVQMDSDGLFLYDSGGNKTFGAFLDYFSGEGDIGDVLIGSIADSNYMYWDDSAGTFTVNGAINASSGNFTGTINIGSAGRVYIDGTNEIIKVYDGDGYLRVELGKLT